MSRSLRTILPSFSCSACMTPISRHGTRQPGNVGASMSTSTSSGAPSPPCVPGTKPESNGNTEPHGSTLLRENPPAAASYLNLLRLPWTVSTMTLRAPDSASQASREVEFMVHLDKEDRVRREKIRLVL